MFSLVFQSDEPLIRSCLLYLYGKGSHLPNFSNICLNSNNNEVSLFISYLTEYISSGKSNCVPQAAVLSYLKLKTPKWNEDFEKVKTQYELTMRYLDQLLHVDLSLTENYPISVQNFISKITDFMDNYKKCKMLISEIRGQFSDYSPFLKESEDKVNFSIAYLEQSQTGKDQGSIPDQICESNDKSVFVHYAISETINSQTDRALHFLKSEIDHLHQLVAQIPNYDAIFEQYRIELRNIGPILESQLFDKLNTFYYFVLSKEAVAYVKQQLSQCCSTYSASSCAHNEDLSELMKRTFQSFRLFCASMALKKPELSEIKCEYQLSKNEKECLSMKNQIQSIKAMDTEIAEINKGIDQMNTFSSVCIVCNKYCASYLCPHCHLCLHCLLCKRINFICPGCHQLIKEPLKINKTSYFGDEFRIDLLQRREKQKKDENA